MSYKCCRDCMERNSLVEHGIFTCHDFCKIYLKEKEIAKKNRERIQRESCADYISFVSDMKTLGETLNSRMNRRG